MVSVDSQVFTTVHDNERLSQRSLASELSIALGLTNTYLKRCIKKGLIKVRQAPANRYAYYLTPHGFTEKTRLTAEYLTQSLGLFRAARNEAAKIYQDCIGNDWRRIVLVGDGDRKICRGYSGCSVSKRSRTSMQLSSAVYKHRWKHTTRSTPSCLKNASWHPGFWAWIDCVGRHRKMHQTTQIT